MPQLDYLILSSQIAFVVVFIFGYFVFLKTLLPLISMEMKLKNKRILKQMLWLKKNLPETNFFRFPFSKLMIKTRGMLNVINYIVVKKNVFFGIYPMDLYYIKHKKEFKK